MNLIASLVVIVVLMIIWIIWTKNYKKFTVSSDNDDKSLTIDKLVKNCYEDVRLKINNNKECVGSPPEKCQLFRNQFKTISNYCNMYNDNKYYVDECLKK
jgi:hypothetical protein